MLLDRGSSYTIECGYCSKTILLHSEENYIPVQKYEMLRMPASTGHTAGLRWGMAMEKPITRPITYTDRYRFVYVNLH